MEKINSPKWNSLWLLNVGFESQVRSQVGDISKIKFDFKYVKLYVQKTLLLLSNTKIGNAAIRKFVIMNSGNNSLNTYFDISNIKTHLCKINGVDQF